MNKSLIKLPIFFCFFLTLLISFSLQAKSLQSNINQPYGLFFVEAYKQDKDIFAGPALKTDVHVEVQGLRSKPMLKRRLAYPAGGIC